MSNDDKIKHWDNMYQMPLDQIPWEIKDPPKELVELIDSHQINGGEALDIACGSGNYSFYLARNGFDVIGIDFSKRAISIAIRNAERAKLPVHFIVGDVTKLKKYLPDSKFDFILDYSILHHIELPETKHYARQFTELLNPGGKLLLLCFSDKDVASNEKGGKIIVGKFGNTMFYRTADEIREAYRDLRELYYKETKSGRKLNHIAHCFLFEKP